MPGSSRATYNRLFDSLGQVRLRDGEVIKTGSSCKDLKTKSKSSSSSPSNAKILEVLASKKSKANQPFRYYKRGKAPYTKAQSQQAKPDASAKSSNRRKRGKNKKNH